MPAEAPSVVTEILLLAQLPEDVEVIREATGDSHISVVDACPNILSFLRREGEYSFAPRPDLILLDLDLSNPRDCELLTDIKKDHDFRRISIVVLTSSGAHEDVFQAYSLHANAYIHKPEDRERFVVVIRTTLNFWLALARLPRE
jgi:CheY-like chemotaxis protein